MFRAAVVGTGELAPDAIERRRQHPVLERRPIAQGARLARQNRHIMPGIVDRLAPAVAAAVFGHRASILADDDPIGVGVDVDELTALALTEYLLLSNRTRQVFDTEAGNAWKPSKRPQYEISFGRSASKTSQIV